MYYVKLVNSFNLHTPKPTEVKLMLFPYDSLYLLKQSILKELIHP